MFWWLFDKRTSGDIYCSISKSQGLLLNTPDCPVVLLERSFIQSIWSLTRFQSMPRAPAYFRPRRLKCSGTRHLSIDMSVAIRTKRVTRLSWSRDTAQRVQLIQRSTAIAWTLDVGLKRKRRLRCNVRHRSVSSSDASRQSRCIHINTSWSRVLSNIFSDSAKFFKVA